MSGAESAAGGIRVTTLEGVAELRLCSGDSRNALSSAMWTELRRFAKSVAGDRAVRVILLAGDETVFSSGADVREFAALRAPGATRAYDDLVESALRALEAVPQPTLACIAGPCVGAGASLACACDLRIADASRSASTGRVSRAATCECASSPVMVAATSVRAARWRSSAIVSVKGIRRSWRPWIR